MTSQNLLVDWNNNYWSTAVLLASLTDLDAYHYQAQQFLASWICSASNVITYTKQGRAWNANKGALTLACSPAGLPSRVLVPAFACRSPGVHILLATAAMNFILGNMLHLWL